MKNVIALVQQQRDFFNTGVTKEIPFRVKHLRLLEQLMKANEQILLDAVYADLKKSPYDTYSSELSLVYREIEFMVNNMKPWSRKRRVKTNLANFPARSYLLPEPYGVTYIAGAWNFPYQLTLIPLVDSLAAGNTAVVKPSEVAPHTSAAMAKLINDNFSPEYVHVIEGGADVAQEILRQKFDYIFFTGGTTIGAMVYEAAAKQLTPVTLELGGKNPVFVLPDCHIEITAKRILWGKFFNAGQSCVAPDFLLVHSSVEQQLLEAMKEILERHYSQTEIKENFTAIINRRHFDRIKNLVDTKKIFYGGVFDASTLFISPTIVSNVSFNDEIMKEEVFGPVLPVVRYNNLDDAIDTIKQYPKPLSLYVFGSNNEEKEKIFSRLSFGGGSFNDTVMYFVNDNLPFGGVGASGIGAYHGFEGFRTFSHYKSIMEKPTWIEFWFLKSPPFRQWKKKLLRLLFEKM
jgi:aldehyde dehydrogenase (NAD+)